MNAQHEGFDPKTSLAPSWHPTLCSLSISNDERCNCVILLADINRKAYRSVSTPEFMSLMCNVENVALCIETATTGCLRVWQFYSFNQIQRYHHEWHYGKAREDAHALLLSLVAIGSRYIDQFNPSCAGGIRLYRLAEELLSKTRAFEISADRLEAMYANVWLPELNLLNH